MTVRDLDKLFKPEAVALIGATPRHGSLGAMLARNRSARRGNDPRCGLTPVKAGKQGE
jgi:hypothetical protein